MKEHAFTIMLLALLSAPLQASTLLGIYAGGGSIDFDTSGTFRDLNDNGTTIDLEEDLNLSGDAGTYWYIGIEHGIPILPNLKVARTEMEQSSVSRLSRNIVFDGVIFPAGSAVMNELDLSHLDLTLYYEVLDNWLNLDLGITARKFDGGIQSQATYFNTRVTAVLDMEFTTPLLYAKGQIDLPLSGLYVAGDINWAGYDGTNFYDLWAKLGYVFKFGLGVEVGYRKMQLDADDIEDLEADVTIDGNYVAVVFSF